MSIMRSLLVFSVFSGLVVYFNQAVAQVPSPQPVQAIDVKKYQGTWYEIARLPMYFQRKCASDVTATYRLNPDQTIHVDNQCKNKQGKVEASTGIAYAQNAGKSQLKVSFLPKGLRWIPFTQGDYWILKIDPQYQVALVGGPSHKYLWLLSRTPTLDETIVQSYLQTAKAQGYDLSNLIRTEHSSK